MGDCFIMGGTASADAKNGRGNNGEFSAVEECEDGGGFRVLKVHPGTPAEAAGFEIFFDFITQIDELPLSSPTRKTFEEFVGKINRRERSPVRLQVFNARTHTWRTIVLQPAPAAEERRVQQQQGGATTPTGGGATGAGVAAAAASSYFLGLVVGFSASRTMRDEGLRVLALQSSASPAAAANFVPFQDWILADERQVFKEVEDLVRVINKTMHAPLQLFVYNAVSDSLRKVVIVPSNTWGGKGSLGCELGVGYIHRLPFCSRLPNAAATATAEAHAVSPATTSFGDSAASRIPVAAYEIASSPLAAAALSSETAAAFSSTVTASDLTFAASAIANEQPSALTQKQASEATPALQQQRKPHLQQFQEQLQEDRHEEKSRLCSGGDDQMHATAIDVAATATAETARTLSVEELVREQHAAWASSPEDFPLSAYSMHLAAEGLGSVQEQGEAEPVSVEEQERREQPASSNASMITESEGASQKEEETEVSSVFSVENGENDFLSFPQTNVPLSNLAFFAALPPPAFLYPAALPAGAAFCCHYTAAARPPSTPAAKGPNFFPSPPSCSSPSKAEAENAVFPSRPLQQQDAEEKSVSSSPYLAYDLPYATTLSRQFSPPTFTSSPHPGEIVSLPSIH